MSSSVFKEYPSEQNDEGGSNEESNLVVFIDKNGRVIVDPKALQDLLVNNKNKSVSVVRLETLEEIDENDESKKELAKAIIDSDNVSESDDSKEVDEEIDEDQPSNMPELEEVPKVKLTVENFFNPAETKLLASEILSLAGITNPLQMSVDFEFIRYLIRNEHCYSLFHRNPTKDLDDQTTTVAPIPVVSHNQTDITAAKKNTRKTSLVPTENSIELSEGDEVEHDSSDDDGEYNTDSDQSFVSPSESDRDSDQDFCVNERNSKGRKFNKTRPAAKLRPVKQTNIVKKRQSITGDPLQVPDEDCTKKTHKKKLQSTHRVDSGDSTPVEKSKAAPAISIPTKLHSPEKSIQKIVNVTINPKTSKKINVQPGNFSKVITVSGHTHLGPDAAAKLNVQIVKNIKKTNVPAGEAKMSSDIKSLFSPDIMRKVPTTQSDTPTNNKVTNISVINLPPVTLIPIPLSNTNSTTSNQLGKTLFKNLTPNQNRQCLIQGQTSTIRPPIVINNPNKNIVFSNIAQRQQTLQATTPINNSSTRTIVNLVGNPTSSGLHVLGRPGIASISTISNNVQLNSSNVNTISFPSGGHITNETPIVTDVDLLEGLDQVESLSDDLMQHVAKLAEDKNLQKVIDQQVLGVPPLNILRNPVTPVSTNTSDISTVVSTPPIKLKPNKMPAPKMPVTPTTPTQVLPSKPRPEPIKIVRSDGRVITLPPIEAPTTRGAKRRAQNQNPNDTSLSSPAPATPPVKLDVSTPKVVKRRSSVAADRRSSVALDRRSSVAPDRRSSVAPDRRQSVAKKSIHAKANTTPLTTGENPIEIIDLDDDMEEDGSDGSYNSEDDPYRIWCICRQPHNNRFMICCDKCEDWFHGKCVNVTKAMGVELEERGVEWVCPNCIKKHPHLQQRQLAVLSKKLPSRKSSNSSLVQELSATASILDNSLQSCIVCKKAARLNSIYCSDDCIRIHAHTTKSVPTNVTMSQETNVSKTTTTEPAAITTTSNTTQSTTPAIPAMKKTVTTNPTKVSKISSNSAKEPTSSNPQNTTLTSNQPKTTIITQLTIKKASHTDASSSTKPKMQSTPLSSKLTISQESSQKRSNHVDVFEPSTGRCLTGFSAPTADNLNRWLQDHPTFQVVQPGSASSAAFKAKKQQLQQLAKTMAREEQNKLFAVSPQQQKIQTTLKIGPSKNIVIINPQTQSTVQPQSPKASNKPVVSLAKSQQKISSPTLSAGTPKQPQASSSKTASPASSSQKTTPSPSAIKRKSDVKPVSTSTSSGRTNVTPEPIRESVQRTLQEQLTLRMDEQTDASFPKLTDEEIETFVKETEQEIYALFNKDTGVKYRAKYRSLMFNVTDRKNTSLFLKICDRSITPQRLVRMSAEELASQELAQWRENENKHQLEMIKKSELEILACKNSYVLKTHKGEEEIQGSTSDRVSLDPLVAVEDVVSVLNNTAAASTSENPDEKTTPVKDNRIDSRFERNHSAENVISAKQSSTSKSTAVSGSSSKRERSPHRESSHSDSKKHKSSRSSSKHRKRSHEHRSPSDSDRHKDKGKGETSRTESSSDKKEDRSRDKHKSSKSISSDSSNKDRIKDDQRKRDENKKRSSDSRIVEPPKATKSVVKIYDIVDEILKAQSNSIIKPDDSVPQEKVLENKPKPTESQVKKTTDIAEDTSRAVTIPTPPESNYHQNDSPIDLDGDAPDCIWSGSLFMVDVATLFVSVSPLVGESANVAAEMPDELNVVGRINPDIVWDYIAKIRKSVNKDILVVRFKSSLETQDNIEAYTLFYHYLTHRKRFGVIKMKSAYIKDFYIFPLAAHKSMPSVLPSPGKEFDIDREDMLVGIIVLNINVTVPPSKKRPSLVPPRSSTPKLPRISETLKTSVSSLAEEARYTPPCSPKVTNSAATTLKTAPKTMVKPLDTVMDDGDEPYSPGGSDEDDGAMPYSTIPFPNVVTANPFIQSIMSSASNSRDQLSPSTPLDKVTIQREVEELTRQIEAQKMEIAGMIHDGTRAAVPLDEPYSPTSMLGADKSSAGTLSGIAIPANLQEILNSIKGPAVTPSLSYSNEEYDPTAVVPSATAYSYQSMNVGYVPAVKSNTTSKLAQLTDEELLSMVPDDAREHLVAPKKSNAAERSGGSSSSMTRTRYHLQSALHPPGVDEDEYVP